MRLLPAALGLGLLGVAGPALAASHPESTRVTRPTTLMAGVGFPAGLDLSLEHSFSDAFAAGASAAGIVAPGDFGGGLYGYGRTYGGTGQRAALFAELAVGGVVLQSSAGEDFRPFFALTAGYQHRAFHGFTVEAWAGVAMPVHGTPLPVVAVQLGQAFRQRDRPPAGGPPKDTRSASARFSG